MVVAETMMGISAFKASMDMVKALKDIDDRTRRNEIAIELQEKILGTQAAQATLIEQVGELEKEVAALKAWDAEKQRYELKELRGGLYVYIPKIGMENGEPPHALCANCYQRGAKSILQSNGEPIIHKHAWVCHSCRTTNKSGYHDMKKLITWSRAPESA